LSFVAYMIFISAYFESPKLEMISHLRADSIAGFPAV
jgi:hypothetical protein